MNIIKTKEKAVEIILKQKPLILYQGHSEWGPRALGNRSILFDPRNKEAKNIVNDFKGREWWRPLAGSILIEHVHDYFVFSFFKRKSKYVFCCRCKRFS